MSFPNAHRKRRRNERRAEKVRQARWRIKVKLVGNVMHVSASFPIPPHFVDLSGVDLTPPLGSAIVPGER